MFNNLSIVLQDSYILYIELCSHISVLQGEKIQTILKAANVNVESYWPGLFAKALEGVNVKELITNIGSGVGAAPAGAGGMYIFFIKRFILI